VLWVAALRNCEYEWKQHVVQGADAGMTRAEVECVAQGSDVPGWSSLERAILRAVDELVSDASVADETWSVLAAELDTQQLMDVVFTVGCYELIAMFFNSAGVQADGDLNQYLARQPAG
jgi:alkylhydroperoxidase family enzyme